MFTFKVYYRNSRNTKIRSIELKYDIPYCDLDLNTLWENVLSLSLKLLEPHEVLVNIKIISAKEARDEN